MALFHSADKYDGDSELFLRSADKYDGDLEL